MVKERTVYVCNDGREFEARADAEHHENKNNLTTRLRAHLNWDEAQIVKLLEEIGASYDLEMAFQDFLKSTAMLRVINGGSRGHG